MEGRPNLWIPRAEVLLTVVAAAGLAFGIGWFAGVALTAVQNP